MRKLAVSIIIFISLCGFVLAEDNQQTRDPIIWDIGLRLLGADLGMGFRGLTQVPNPDTVIWLIVGGGYEWLNYFRNPANELYTGGGGFDATQDPYYDRINGRLDVGFAQGFIFNEKLKTNLFEAFIFYKTRLDYVVDNASKNELILASGRSDAAGIFQNSILVGLTYNDLDKTSPHRFNNGIYAETSVEWGPEFLFNNIYGRADFVRLNLTAKAFVPLFDLEPKAEVNVFSGYLGFFFAVDYCTGNYLPINIQQSIGGRKPRAGMGWALRGYEDARFDGQLKIVGNVEYRMNLPAFKIVDSFTPGIVAFFDSGYYHFGYYEESGFLFSTGIGAYINLWGLTTVSVYTVALLSKPLVANGSYWAPFWISLDAHF